jgi:hypothetical protein
MKAILIDVEKREVREVEIGDGIDPIYEQLKCDCFTCVDIDDRNTVYVDDEGLLKVNRNSVFFQYDDGEIPLVGNGLILGTDYETGESIDTNLNVEDVRKTVKFLTYGDVLALMD